MTLSAKQLRIASQIDARMQMLLRIGKDDVAILDAMAGQPIMFPVAGTVASAFPRQKPVRSDAVL